MSGIAAALALLLAAGPAAAGGHHDHGPAPRAEAPRAARSIYALDAKFLDQTGARAGLDVARGHPVLISMFYASCTEACPLLIADLRQVEAALPERVRADVHVVLVSLDPERDRPNVLQALATAHGVARDRWHFLTGTADGARDVAAILGVRYRRLSTGVINHTALITLLDRQGVPETRVEGRPPVATLADRIVALKK